MGIRRVVVLVLLLWASAVHATTFVVDSVNDAGPGSLRAAITNANGAQGSNTIAIDIDPAGAIVLATPLPPLRFTLTIMGPGAKQLTIRGDGTGPVFTIDGTVELSGMTITGGANIAGNGGGIAVTGGSLALLDSVVTGNAALVGAGIHAAGPLTILNSTISGNEGTGAIHCSDEATLADSTIADNMGTAIVFASAGKTLSISRSTISGNTEHNGIGGLQLQGGTADIRSTTFSGNTGSVGGDFGISIGVALSLTNVTAVGGSLPGLLFDTGSTIMVRNTLFAGTGARCSPGTIVMSQGHNLSSDATCNFTAATDRVVVAPVLGPLADNGGRTRTHAPLAGSPALNAGDGTGLGNAVDQRGKPRVQFGTVDIGAVEVTEPMIMTQPAAQSLAEGDSFSLSVAAMNQNSATPLAFQWRKDGAPIAGATAATFAKPGASVEDSGLYDVLVSNDGGGIASARVAVTVMPAIRGDGSPMGDDGGCCSSTARGTWPTAVLGAMLVLGGGRRRRRSR
jgi:hypothetical protein